MVKGLAECCSVLQYVVKCCCFIVLQCVAVCCSMLQWVAYELHGRRKRLKTKCADAHTHKNTRNTRDSAHTHKHTHAFICKHTYICEQIHTYKYIHIHISRYYQRLEKKIHRGIAVCCSELLRVAVCCIVLQKVAYPQIH